ncbi:MAG: Rrf2 family transcriptional regulator [Candidatus Sungiibacteriota bacterium]|uniref:Rrf2 family transcriptional regulator n=1 Tax=Candidatus Sungiibacteriota bacterium TaxID=2750080 RepID=A0A7T5RK06_9BACT|nr:MAG: Rrf2 family transcriptional regulator [Candidatus Sungbacteria bacterium]
MKKRFDYALILIEYLKQKKETFADVRTVAGEFHLPRAYLEKVAQELKHAGWLESRRGAGGGYRLAESRRAASVGNLIDFYAPIYSLCPVLRTIKKL